MEERLWVGGQQGAGHLSLALLLCGAGQAVESSCSASTRCTASCPLPRALQSLSLPVRSQSWWGSLDVSVSAGRKQTTHSSEAEDT